MRMRWPLAALLGPALLAVWAAAAPAQTAPAPMVTELELDGAVDPFIAGYL
jgi:membrane-bound ClpP family serine protease